ncbi:hypothetical protein [Tellurirhabdus bombi]|uniref:hypothetical protein n=1 Tax=Tellurirhabdus bombi TaxID=2907205 RepID=UPI001F245915|nr:hypothetical protein [Tellurirhabdus bombi]
MKIIQFELLTNDLNSTQDFYAGKLGLPLLARRADSYLFQVGWSSLLFRLTDQPVASYHFAFNVQPGTLDQLVNRLPLSFLDAGQPGEPIAHFPDWKARACYFQDPNDNVVELIERRDAAYAGALFSPIQGISEVGLVTDDVPSLSRQLTTAYNLEQFDKTLPKEDFNAIGDDFGLFILSQTARKWLFTDIPALAQHSRVLFTDHYNVPHLLTTSAQDEVLVSL